MVNIPKLRTASWRWSTAALLGAALLTTTAVVQEALSAGENSAIQVVAGETNSRFVPLGIGKSIVLDLPRDVKDVLVADPKIANAVIRTSRRVYLIGVKRGQTNMVFFDADGRQIAALDVAVTRDLNGVRTVLGQLFRNNDIRIDGIGDGVVLTGSVANPAEAQQAFDIAARLVCSVDESESSGNSGGTTVSVSSSSGGGGGSSSGGCANKVVNGITIRGRDQVMLKVTVAEVQRDVIKQLGVDISGSLGTGTSIVNFNTNNPFTVSGQPISNTAIVPGFDTNLGRVQATIRAMERAGVIRTLAEPNLSAISGESANFLAGGEFPVITGTSCSPPGSSSCTASVDFKKFGVSLGFTPVVLSEGRISLKVMTEVSELSTEGALVSQGLTIPSLKVRRADTTLEIPSGGSLAMAGLISEQTKQNINGLPGLEQLPVLGTLFRSRDYVNRQSELMVLVTPYIVRAVAQKDLSRPDDGFADVSDPSTVLLGRLNRIYGIQGSVDPRGLYRGNYGFILD